MAKASEHASADTAEFMAAAGVTTVDELRRLPVEELLKAHAAVSAARIADPQAVIERTGSPVAFLAFTPVADGVVVPTDPLAAVAGGSAAGVDLVVGTNLEEWKLFAMMTPAVDGHDGLRSRLALVTDDVDGAIAAYEADHPGASHADVDSALLTDVVFRIPASELADAQAAHASVRQYRFDWKSTAWGGMLGAAHAIEIPFVFDMVSDHRIHVLIGPDAPASLATAVHDAWVSFAVEGAPTVAGLGEWPALPAPGEGDGRPVMVFDADIAVVDDPLGTTRRYWAARR